MNNFGGSFQPDNSERVNMNYETYEQPDLSYTVKAFNQGESRELNAKDMLP